MPRIALPNARTRIVNFRLSEEEHRKLMVSCVANGSRCLSEFARAAVLDQDSIQARLSNLDRRISDLGGKLHRLLEILDQQAC